MEYRAHCATNNTTACPRLSASAAASPTHREATCRCESEISGALRMQSSVSRWVECAVGARADQQWMAEHHTAVWLDHRNARLQSQHVRAAGSLWLGAAASRSVRNSRRPPPRRNRPRANPGSESEMCCPVLLCTQRMLRAVCASEAGGRLTRNRFLTASCAVFHSILRSTSQGANSTAVTVPSSLHHCIRPSMTPT